MRWGLNGVGWKRWCVNDRVWVVGSEESEIKKEKKNKKTSPSRVYNTVHDGWAPWECLICFPVGYCNLARCFRRRILKEAVNHFHEVLIFHLEAINFFLCEKCDVVIHTMNQSDYGFSDFLIWRWPSKKMKRERKSTTSTLENWCSFLQSLTRSPLLGFYLEVFFVVNFSPKQKK